MFKQIFYGLFFFLISCIWGGGTSDPAPVGNLGGDPPPIERRIPKRPDPIKQAECNKKSRSNTCNDNEDCKDICDDVFRSRADKKDCYRLPIGIVEEFEKLLEFAEDGDVEDISPEILECMLDIDEREFAKAIKKMSRTEAREFLVAIADDGYLAEVLEDEDDEFNILKQVLNKATGSNALLVHLTKEIDDGKSFFWFAAAGNEQAFEYLDDYVSEECDGSPQNVCSSGDNIEAYCRALTEGSTALNKRDLEDFLSEADLFAEEYEDDVEDEDYLYEVDDSPDDDYNGDFRDWCQSVLDGSWSLKSITGSDHKLRSSSINRSCPDDGTEPAIANRLARITFADGGPGTGDGDYYIAGGTCHANGWPLPNTGLPDVGESDPEQTLILDLGDWGPYTGGTLDTRYGALSVDKDELKHDSDYTYYLYIEGKRYDLSDSSVGTNEYTEGTINGAAYSSGGGNPPTECRAGEDQREVLTWIGMIPSASDRFSGVGPHDVYLAREKDGSCEYYVYPDD